MLNNKKILFINEHVRIELRGKKIMVVSYSQFEGMTKTYYVTESKDFNRKTDFDSEWNDCNSTWEVLLHSIKEQGLNITTIKNYAVK